MLLRILLLLLTATNAQDQQRLHGWINEFHYRNFQQDVHRFIEIVGPVENAGSDYEIILYQGRDGNQFRDSISLAGHYFEADEEGSELKGYGFMEHDLELHGGIRNGKVRPDGIALVYQDKCVQFLCYGDDHDYTFVAHTGPCIGMQCQNTGVSEPHDLPAGYSLQLKGWGRFMENFTWWETPMEETPLSVNMGQEFMTPNEYWTMAAVISEGD